MSDKMITLLEAAGLIGVPESTLRYWRHIGHGPPGARIGRRVLFREDDVRRWIADQFAAERTSA